MKFLATKNHAKTIVSAENSFYIPNEYDDAANQYATKFRSSGIVIGLLGMLVTCLAIIPSAFNFSHHVVLLLTGLKVFFMLLILLLIYLYSQSDLKQSWLANRIKAEGIRYDWLQNELDVKKTKNLVHDQIHYNHTKIDCYEAVEHSAVQLTWLAFGIALIAACAHFFIHANWLILLTGLFPAIVGIIHGINAFLGFGPMIRDHEYTLASLKDIENKLNMSNVEIAETAKELFWLMSLRDKQWLRLVESTKHMPA